MDDFVAFLRRLTAADGDGLPDSPTSSPTSSPTDPPTDPPTAPKTAADAPGSRHDGAPEKERAAIREDDGNQPREQAEVEAMRQAGGAALEPGLQSESARLAPVIMKPTARERVAASPDLVRAAAAKFESAFAAGRALKNELTALCKKPAGSWLREDPDAVGPPRQAILQHIREVMQELERWRPAAACACGGDRSVGCRRCFGTGWLPQASVRK